MSENDPEKELMPPPSGTNERLALIDELAHELLRRSKQGKSAGAAAIEQAQDKCRELIARQTEGKWTRAQEDNAVRQMLTGLLQRAYELSKDQIAAAQQRLQDLPPKGGS
ncbi:MAG: hypothetical protein E6G95_20255 [Alphaproteobacteria bacterium]|nr:MAG: hypothetical protein E6G95_20255 [Alphaproteobacteria bacterium]